MGVAFGTGVTGALIYLNLLRISPDAGFSINWTAYTIFIVVIGGLGSLEGPLIGTALFFLVREYLSDYGAWYMILLGTLAVGVMLAYPQGLWGMRRRAMGPALLPGGAARARRAGPLTPALSPEGRGWKHDGRA